ncbi:MAG: DedA family protein, partial [Burkholderiales bacterium]
MSAGWLTGLIGPGSELTVLFVASLLAGSILPGGSEAVLFGVLKLNAQLFWPALAVATIGNTLGGLTSYALGRFLPEGKSLSPQIQTSLQRVKRYGSAILLFAWMPWI